MEFNQLISEKLDSLFAKHGLAITEQSQNIIKYESKRLLISLAHNPRENSNTLWLGAKWSNDFVEIDDYVMYEFFTSDLKLNDLPQETFVNNVFLFFDGLGQRVLKGDKQVITSLEKFDEIRSKEYTSELIDNQNIEATNKAWKDGNYSDVISYLGKVNEVNLSSSLKKKYEIASKKISN